MASERSVPEAPAPSAAGPARYRVELKPSAERDLTTLAARDRLRVARKIDGLAQSPRPAGVEKLRGAEDLWRVRAGDFHIIYMIRDDALLVLAVRIGHRREVYRRG